MYIVDFISSDFTSLAFQLADVAVSVQKIKTDW